MLMKRLTAYLRETLDGDSNAFNEVVLRFQEGAMRKAYGKLKDYRPAEEAVQDAFLTAFKNLASLRSLDRFPGWFRAILLSCIARTIRRNGFSFSYEDPNDLNLVEALIPCGQDDLEQRELFGLVNRAIESLPSETRSACTYFYLYG